MKFSSSFRFCCNFSVDDIAVMFKNSNPRQVFFNVIRAVGDTRKLQVVIDKCSHGLQKDSSRDCTLEILAQHASRYFLINE